MKDVIFFVGSTYDTAKLQSDISEWFADMFTRYGTSFIITNCVMGIHGSFIVCQYLYTISNGN